MSDEVTKPEEVTEPKATRLARRADQALASTLKPDYERPVLKKTDALATVSARYLEACEAGDRRSCWMSYATRHSDRAVALLRRNCLAGDRMSCRALPRGERDERLPGWAGRWNLCVEPECQEVMRPECVEGFARSCRNLYVLQKQERERGLTLAIEGCRAGLLEECEGLEDLEPHGAAHALAITQICTLTALCDHLVRFEPDPVKARDMLERTCQYARKEMRITACDTLADGYRDQLYPEPVPGRGRALAELRCAEMNFGPDSACMQEARSEYPEAGSP